MKRHLYNYLFVLFASSVLLAVNAQAQVTGDDSKVIIRGKVIDGKDKSPMMHVSVAETDADGRTVRGVTTDIDGNYALKITNLKDKITFSYIGYKTIAEDIKGRRAINITLEVGGNDLDEVVMLSGAKTSNGNLAISDRNLTISSVKINAKDLEEMGSTTIDQALQGRMAGVDIVATSGDPGAGMSIRIRGTSSLTAGTNPLIVVDGMPYATTVPADFNFGTADDQGYAQLLNIAPSDIKDITVLKDAAATAMWGSRAANGVLVINTKRGVVGKPVLTYTERAILSKQPSNIPLLNGNQYSTLIPEEVMNATGTPLNTINVPELSYDPNNPYYYYNYTKNTDWLKAITQIGYTYDNNISMTGGGEKARYFASLGYLSQSGTTVGTDLDRVTTRVNLDYFVSQRIRFRTDFSYTYTNNPKSYSTVLRNVAMNKMPNMSIYEYNAQGQNTGNYFSPASNIQGYYPTTYNPVAMANTATNRVLGSRVTPHFNVQYDIVPRVLVITSDVQFDINNTKNKSFLPQIATGRPVTETTVNLAYDGDVDVFDVQSKTNLVYTPKLPTNHSVIALMSLQTDDTKTVSNQAQTSNTASSLLQDPSIPSRTGGANSNVSQGNTQTRAVGLLVNAQYGYKEKYLFNVGLRGDGNSRFGTNHLYGLFPSISGRWRVSGEKFFMERFKFVNDFSIRASYGASGNAPTTDYSFYNQYLNMPWSYQGQSSVYNYSMELSNLRWEVVHGTNLGFNLDMYQNRVRFSLDLYRNRTTDLFFNGLRIPTYTGFSSVNLNIGTMDNQGWEVNIMTTPLKTKKWIIDFNLNISHNDNVIRYISPFYPNQSGDMTTNGNYLALLQVNNPFGSIYGYKYQGVYKDANATIATDAKGGQITGPNGQAVYMRFNYPNNSYIFQPGDAKYADINHDGNIDYRDVVYLGNSNPKFSGGFGPTITYKNNLKISAFFNFRTSYDVVNGTRMQTTNMYGFNNQSTAVLKRWRNPGDVTDMPRALYNAGYNWLGSDRYVEDASFLKLRSITVRYNFTQALLKKLRIKAFSAYLTAENLITFTKYLGQDPEVSSTTAPNPFNILTDLSNTPPPIMFTLGVTATF